MREAGDMSATQTDQKMKSDKDNVAAPPGQERADKEGTTQLMTCQGDEIMS